MSLLYIRKPKTLEHETVGSNGDTKDFKWKLRFSEWAFFIEFLSITTHR